MDCSLPGSSAHGIFQARVLEWGAIAFSISRFSCVQFFETLWTVAHQAPLSFEFSRQKYWSGWLCPPPGDLPDPRIESMSLMSPALILRFFTINATWEALDVPEDPQSEHVENQSQHPCLQTNFPFSVNNATSIWSPKRETGRHSKHPVPHGTPSPGHFTPLTSPGSACPLHPHSAGSWQTPSWSPCLWTHFLLSPPIDQESAFFLVYKGPGGVHFWLCGPKGLQRNYLTLSLLCESNTDNTQKNECGCVPNKNHVLTKTGGGPDLSHRHSLLALALHWDENDLSKSQVQLYLLSCLKAFTVFLSAPSSSQSPVDMAPCQLSHWRLHYAPWRICSMIYLVC